MMLSCMGSMHSLNSHDRVTSQVDSPTEQLDIVTGVPQTAGQVVDDRLRASVPRRRDGHPGSGNQTDTHGSSSLDQPPSGTARRGRIASEFMKRAFWRRSMKSEQSFDQERCVEAHSCKRPASK